MELRHLRYFVIVAEEQNLRRAAARLNIAPPPLSVLIRKLELEIGADLFAREGRSIRLTEAGRVFLDQARQTLADVNRGVAMARQAANGEIGHLSIGYNPVAEFRIFPQVIPAFKKKWPAVHLSFHSFKSARYLEALRREELDLGVVWLPIPTEDFDIQPLTKESFVIVLPSDHRLASASSCSIRALSEEPLVLFPRAIDPDTYHQIEHLFIRAGAAMTVAYELESALSVINFVAMGSGCSILPDYVRKVRQDGIVYRPLERSDLERTLAIVKKKGKGGLADSFFRFVADNFRAEAEAAEPKRGRLPPAKDQKAARGSRSRSSG